MTSQPRPARCIWITGAELGLSDASLLQLVEDRFLAAPADAAEAAKQAIWQKAGKGCDTQAHAVLLVLGCPHTEQA